MKSQTYLPTRTYWPVSSGHHLCVMAMGQACLADLVDSSTRETVATLTGPVQIIQAMENGLAKYYPRVIGGKLTLAVISHQHGSWMLSSTAVSQHPDALQSAVKDSMIMDLQEAPWSQPMPL